VTHLRKMMLEELARRNYSAGTTRRYLRFVERFAQHFHKSPDKLDPDDLRSYQAYLFRELKLCPGSVEKRIAFGSRQTYSLFRFLIPSSHSRCMCPAILGFEETCCGIESEPIVISCRGSERLRMNFVHHDVDMKMLFVVVRDNHILMVFISKPLQCLNG